MKRRLAGFALSSATGALCNALPPVVAVLLLQPTEYGLFSIPYLAYAFGVSLQYSVVSEAWARLHARGAGTTTWRDYSSALGMLAALVGLIAVVICVIVPNLRASTPFVFGAVTFAVYQNGARYYRVATGSLRRVLASDVAGILGFVVGMLALGWLPHVSWIAGAWLLGGAAAFVVLGLPRFAWGSGLFAWSRRNHRMIRPLLGDSLLMDAGAIGTPFLLAGLMEARDFGIYRAVANVAMPVRLLIEPLRPVIGRMAPRRLYALRSTVLILASGVALSTACYLVLVLVLPRLDFQLGTLVALVPHALPTSLFVAGNLWVTIYYVVCRTNATHRRLMVGRLAQTALVVVLPIAGFLVGGLAGGIWGFGVSSVLSAGVWAVLARPSEHGDERGHAEPGDDAEPLPSA